MSALVEGAGVPFPLTPSEHSSWNVGSGSASVDTTAAARTDIFIDPRSQAGAGVVLNAATLLGTPPQGDFQFTARVTVDFVSTFSLGHDATAAGGFEAQSPTGDGCSVRFDSITFETAPLADLRDGS